MIYVPVSAPDRRRRVITVLMVGEALSLAAVSVLHLTGILGGGRKPYDPGAAGIAEAVIGVALFAGALTVVRSPKHGYTAAQAATGFAVAGFILGLVFSLTGGRPSDVIYHVTMLPVLVLTFVLSTVWTKGRGGGGSRRSGCDSQR